MKGNLSRCLAFAICLLCFAAVGASIVFKWKKIASEDNAIWKLRADYDAWGRGNVFVRNMFAFNYAGDIPIECFKKYSSGSFSERNYWNFITKKFNKYKEDFLKNKNNVSYYRFDLKHIKIYVLLKPGKEDILDAVGYSFYRPSEGIYLCCDKAHIFFEDGKMKIGASMPYTRMPFSEEESDMLSEDIKNFYGQNRKAKNEKKKELESYACMKILDGNFYVLDGILAKETFSEILRKNK